MADIRKREGRKGTTYQVRFQKNGQTGFRSFPRRKDAQAFIESLSTRKSIDARITSMTGATDLWLQVCRNEGRDGRPPVSSFTYGLYEYWAGYINDYDWGKDIQELARPDIVNFRSHLLREVGRYRAQKTLSALHSVFLEMMARGIMAHDPAAGVTVRNDREPLEIPTEAEVKSILKAADDLMADKNKQTARTWQRYRPMIWLAAGSGMRPQEYLALPRRDVLPGGVRISQALKKTGDIGVPKTKASLRHIYVDDETMGIVTEYMKAKTSNDADLVFGTAAATPIQVENYRKRAWNVLMEKAGLVEEEEDESKNTIIVPRYTPYALRHFFASVLLSRGVNIKLVQQQMGHTKASITLDTYGHLLKNQAGSDAETVRAAMQAVRTT